jgi:sugar O-acyltransferase (sialic acid O-acetyltransferase NeuD family)
MPVELLIIGTSGQARETAQLARQIDPARGRWSRISYVCETPEQRGQELPYGDVRYTDSELQHLREEVDVAIGIGRPALRSRIARQLGTYAQLRFPNLVHPSVEIDASVVAMGQGNMICKGVVMTCDVVVGDFNLINWNVTIGHDTRIGSCCVVNPGCNVSGHVTVGDGCLIGTGTQILETVEIVSNTVVGAGSLIRCSIHEAGTWVGVPARRIK